MRDPLRGGRSRWFPRSRKRRAAGLTVAKGCRAFTSAAVSNPPERRRSLRDAVSLCLLKGIVFNLLERLVVSEYGEETWETLLEACGLDGVYTSLGSYPDEDLFGLVGAASDALDVPADDIVRWFGRGALPLFAERYPHLFSGHDDARSFVLTLNDIIHPEVRKLYPGAIVPEFGFDSSAPSAVGMDYYSPRKLCAFAEGLLLGAADHYGETVTIEQSECMNRGDAQCHLQITFSPQT